MENVWGFTYLPTGGQYVILKQLTFVGSIFGRNRTIEMFFKTTLSILSVTTLVVSNLIFQQLYLNREIGKLTGNCFTVFLFKKMQFWNNVDCYYPSKLSIIMIQNKTWLKVNSLKYVNIINAILTTLPTSCFTKVCKSFRYYFQ